MEVSDNDISDVFPLVLLSCGSAMCQRSVEHFGACWKHGGALSLITIANQLVFETHLTML